MAKFENVDDELNKLFKDEGHRVVQEAVKGEIADNERQLADVRNAMRVLDGYAGDGLADGMPLGEALGFLGAELEKKKPKMNEDEIRRAREFLLDLVGEKYPAGMPVGALMGVLSKEEKELLG